MRWHSVVLAISAVCLSFQAYAGNDLVKVERPDACPATVAGKDSRTLMVHKSVRTVLDRGNPGDPVELNIHLVKNNIQMVQGTPRGILSGRRLVITGPPLTEADYNEIKEALRQRNPEAQFSGRFYDRLDVGLITVTAPRQAYRAIFDTLYDPSLPVPDKVEIYPIDYLLGGYE